LKSDIKISQIVLSDIVEPRSLAGFEDDARVVKLKNDLSDPAQVDELFKDRTYTAVAAFHGLMSVKGLREVRHLADVQPGPEDLKITLSWA